MKTLFLIVALMLININLFSAPPDSCLWAPDLTMVNEPVAVLSGHFDNEDPFNRDSTLYVDTCGLYSIFYRDSAGNLAPIGGSQYRFEKRYYAKSFWGLSILWSIFDTVGKDLNNLKYFTFADIDTNQKDIYTAFQKVVQKYGNIKFWFSLNKDLSIQTVWVNSNDKGYYSYIETENLVNAIEFEEYMNVNLPGFGCLFYRNIGYTVTVRELTDTNFNIKVSQDYNSLIIQSDKAIQSIMVYSLTGNKLIDLTDNNNDNTVLPINISYLEPGVYFIKINETFYKFMVVR